MSHLHLPTSVTQIISAELTVLDRNQNYELSLESRVALYQAIGPSHLSNSSAPQQRQTHNVQKLPDWTRADRVRSQISLLTAQKILPLWETACLESKQKNFTEGDWQQESEKQLQEQVYFHHRKMKPIEEISVYDVPRAYTPYHILEMTELALAGNVQDYAKFVYQANEWWQIYPRPELMEREFFIKWACQEALYEVVGLTKHWPQAPAQDAVRAYAGNFYGEGFENRRMEWNTQKLNEFWRWWLMEAIPIAWQLEG